MSQEEEDQIADALNNNDDKDIKDDEILAESIEQEDTIMTGKLKNNYTLITFYQFIYTVEAAEVEKQKSPSPTEVTDTVDAMAEDTPSIDNIVKDEAENTTEAPIETVIENESTTIEAELETGSKLDAEAENTLETMKMDTDNNDKNVASSPSKLGNDSEEEGEVKSIKSQSPPPP
jgi:hypothetical protein